MKVLNLYAGIGGNRKLWEGVDVTAVEIDEPTAEVYKDYFPNDKVVIADAHQYLLEHYDDFDFIWSSPPCPTHSDVRRCRVDSGHTPPIYPDMSLYQEIILLKNFSPDHTKWVVENVKPYYKPLIPAKEIHRHLYWSNFVIGNFEVSNDRKHDDIKGSKTVYGFNIADTGISNKRKALRNMVDPEIGEHILNRAKGIFKKSNTKQASIFN